ncbi:MAG: chromosomal replication initiator protein DnaA [Bacteroidaceae bacterium]|jgi:chromosomal replication initiator protein|nr:chromosomal replication initiator protein DnaA [Bacteroidaceae bacterium]MBO5965055.1 chromosomal replication initiator protein DnaA [Bacteroidaceae bacterium]MBQ2363313.1 chromosomal replication initiator protein DnaA [Bacteroidaceae bacterium]MBQ5694860.1 chromosomal replication initiator protein DnaA [Bacteroidaceae bacterium]MBQ5840014.1 chromosomal replication initiator protein DnaA [Bacteroidaceae bacterium]
MITTEQTQWKKCLELIRSRLNPQQYTTWFEPIGFKSYDIATKEVTIYVPSHFFYEYLEEHYRQLIYLAIFHVFGPDSKLVYKVALIQDEEVREEGNQATLLREPSSSRPLNRAPGAIHTAAPVSDFQSYLNLSQNFDNFIEGSSNRLPRSVGQSVADQPARKTFNPLFIYGPSGCGKTHLVNAIGVRLRQMHPEKRVLYVSANVFQVQYVDARLNNKTNDFIHFYQSIDCLIVDDVQEFSGKEKTMEAFFHIFNHLHLNGRQIIMTSDRPPVELRDVEERMLTRFKWGMLAELESPDIQLRRDILRQLVSKDGLEISDDVIEYVAEHLQDNVRELEGFVNSMLAYSVVNGDVIDLEFAKKILKANTRYRRRVLNADEIIEVVCRKYKVTNEELCGQSRKAEFVLARQVAMYLTQKHTGDTVKHIGHIIGRRSHATVIHGIQCIDKKMKESAEFKKEIKELEKKL